MNFRLMMALVILGVLLLNWGLSKLKDIEIYLQIFCLIFLIYKTCDYVRLNMIGIPSFPVEFSAVSYFLIPIIVSFRFKSGYPIASFFGMIAGTAFLIYYVIGGASAASVFGTREWITAVVCHSFLLTVGFQLFIKYKFIPEKYYKIWLAVLGMIFNAFAFYDIKPRGTTFVYYIISPDYVKIFDNMSLNMLMMVGFYILLVFVFWCVVKLFYLANQKYHKEDTKPNLCENIIYTRKI